MFILIYICVFRRGDSENSCGRFKEIKHGLLFYRFYILEIKQFFTFKTAAIDSSFRFTHQAEHELISSIKNTSFLSLVFVQRTIRIFNRDHTSIYIFIPVLYFCIIFQESASEKKKLR